MQRRSQNFDLLKINLSQAFKPKMSMFHITCKLHTNLRRLVTVIIIKLIPFCLEDFGILNTPLGLDRDWK